MKKSEKVTIILSVIVCLLPMILGIAVYDRLPEIMATHFDFHNEPNGFMSRGMTVFGMPIILAVLQGVMCFTTFRKNARVEMPKLLKLSIWIIPVVDYVVYVMIVLYALGSFQEIGKAVCLLVGIVFLVCGNYAPKMSFEQARTYHNPAPVDERNFRKKQKLTAILLLAMSLLFFGLLFFV